MLTGRYGKYVIWVLIGGFLIGAVILFTPGEIGFWRQDKEANGIALVVNGEEVSNETFYQAYSNLIEQYRRLYAQWGMDFSQRLRGPEGAYYQLQLQAQVAEELIREVLLSQEGKARGIRVLGSEVEEGYKEELDRILRENNLTEEELLEILRMQGMKFGEFKRRLMESVKAELKKKKLEEAVVGKLEPTDEELIAYIEGNRERYEISVVGELEPTEEELQEYFAKNKDKYLEIKARHILVRVAEGAAEEEVAKAQEKIEEIKKQLDGGADFAELAKEHSEDVASAIEGGDLGYFGKGKMVKEFEEAAFALQPGEISDIVRTPFGFHIIKVEERKEKTFEEVKEELERNYIEEERDRRFEEWLSKVKEGDKEAFKKVRDEVRGDYIDEEVRKRFEDWYKEVREKAEVEIKLVVLAAHLLEEKDLDAAIAEYERIKQQGLSNDPYLSYYIARLYEKKMVEASEQKKELEAAEEPDKEKIAELEALIEESKQKALEGFLAVAEEGRGDEKTFEALLLLDEDNPQVQYQYALFLRQGGRGHEAIKHLIRTLELDPNHIPALILLGDMRMEALNYEMATENYEKALKLKEERGEDDTALRMLKLKLGEAYVNLGDVEKAKEFLNKVLAENPKETKALVLLGDLYFKQESYKEAADYYNQALEISPREFDVLVKLGKTYLESGRLEEAKEAFEDALAISPYVVEAYFGLGDVYQKQGLTEKALEQYRDGFRRARGYEMQRDLAKRILELDPKDIKTRFRLAELYKEEHVFSAAIEQYNAILEQDPNSLAAYKGIGESYMGKVEYEKAKLYFYSAIEVATHPSQKIELYNKILEAERSIVGFGRPLGEDGLDALFNLAKIYFDQKEYNIAKDQLEKLQEENPEYKKGKVEELLKKIEEETKPKETEAEKETQE